MSKVSRKLTNLLIIEGGKSELVKFIDEISKKNIPIISVKCPKDVDNITANFVNKNWNISKYRLEEVLIYAKYKSEKIIIAFCNSDFENLLMDLVEELKLNARYSYYIDDIRKAIVVKEEYRNGVFVDDEETDQFNINKYSIAKCFA